MHSAATAAAMAKPEKMALRKECLRKVKKG